MIFGSPLSATRGPNLRVTRDGRIIPPSSVVNTRPVSTHAEPQASRSSSWRRRWSRMAVTVTGSRYSVRPLSLVLGSARLIRLRLLQVGCFLQVSRNMASVSLRSFGGRGNLRAADGCVSRTLRTRFPENHGKLLTTGEHSKCQVRGQF